MRDEHARHALGVVERAHRVERLRRRRGVELDELRRAVEADQGVREIVRVDEAGGDRVGAQLALRREQEVGERGADRREHGEQEPREESADPAELEKRRREEHGVGLR